jgi:hypothetical protein
MKILKLHSRQFPNALHVQCMTEIGDWAPKFPDLQTKIQGLYNPYMLWLNREAAAYRFVIKSAITAAKETKDRERDDCFHGLYYTTLAATRYYDPAIVAAAKRLLLVLDNFNHTPLVKLSYDAETATVNALLQELSKYASDIVTVGVQNWVDGLTKKNSEFEALAQQYYDEVTYKPEYNMQNARNGIEPALRTLFGFIEVLDVLEGEGTYAPAVQSLNTIIKHFNDVYAQHKGATAAGSESATTEQ